MSTSSGEQNRRRGLVPPGQASPYAPEQGQATIRYSVAEKKRRLADAMRAHKARKDKCRLRGALIQEAARLEAEIAAMPKGERSSDDPLLVSDHAVIRFLERVMGINIDAIRDEISKTVPSSSREDDRIVYIRKGFQFLVFGNRLVSILTEDMDSYIETAFKIDED